MASKAYTETPALGPNGEARPGAFIITWGLMQTGDEGVAYPAPNFKRKTMQLSGTVTSVAIRGTNGLIGGTYADLHDAQGVALTAIGAAGMKIIDDTVGWIKPVVTTGTDVLAALCISERN